jgi:nucleotide-binding universal stress UspA family protein
MGGTGGTIVCGIVDTEQARDAAGLAAALGERLGLRLVLVSAVDATPGGDASVTARQQQDGARRLLGELAGSAGGDAEGRIVVGEPAEGIARVAAEEGADLIVLGSRPGGLGGRKLRCGLAAALEAVTPVPVLIAPPATRRRSGRRLAPPAELATR